MQLVRPFFESVHLHCFLGGVSSWNFGLTYCRSCEFVASSRAWPRWPWGFLSQSLISSSWVCPQRKEWCAIPTWLSHHGTALELMSLHRFCCLAELTLAANRNIIFVKKRCWFKWIASSSLAKIIFQHMYMQKDQRVRMYSWLNPFWWVIPVHLRTHAHYNIYIYYNTYLYISILQYIYNVCSVGSTHVCQVLSCHKAMLVGN